MPEQQNNPDFLPLKLRWSFAMGFNIKDNYKKFF